MQARPDLRPQQAGRTSGLDQGRLGSRASLAGGARWRRGEGTGEDPRPARAWLRDRGSVQKVMVFADPEVKVLRIVGLLSSRHTSPRAWPREDSMSCGLFAPSFLGPPFSFPIYEARPSSPTMPFAREAHSWHLEVSSSCFSWQHR